MTTLNEFLQEAIKRVNRVRRGKVQRRHKVSTKKHYKMKGGKEVLMSAKERRKRRLSQIRAARKRKAILARSLRKRKISMRKAKRLRR